MCYGSERLPSKSDILPTVAPVSVRAATLFDRLMETEARLERARAREAELSRRLEDMKRFVSVMEILETYLNRRYRQQQERVLRILSPETATCS